MAQYAKKSCASCKAPHHVSGKLSGSMKMPELASSSVVSSASVSLARSARGSSHGAGAIYLSLLLFLASTWPLRLSQRYQLGRGLAGGGRVDGRLGGLPRAVRASRRA